MSTLLLLLKHLRARASSSVALAVLVGIAVAVAALLPRGLVVLSDAELQQELASVAPGVTDLYGSGEFGRLNTDGAPTSAEQVFGATGTALAGVPGGLPSPLRDSVGPVTWTALLPPDQVNIAPPRLRVQPVIALAVDLGWQDRVTLTSGTVPTAWNGDEAVPVEIAISQDYAEQAGFAVGDVLDYSEAPLVVSGIYTANDPDDPYWVHAHELLSATVTRAPSSPTVVRAAAFVDPLSTAFLPTALERAELRAWYPLAADTMTFAEVPELADQLRRTVTLGLYLPSGEVLIFETGLPAALDRVTATITTVTAVSALVGSAPLGALIAVLALGARTILDRRRTALALLASRGASQAQLRATMLAEGALVGIPATIIALVAVAVLVPVPVAGETWVLPVLIGISVPVLFATSGLRASARRSDLGGRGSRVRWLVELGVVAIAALALFLLLRRGLVVTGAGAVDPLLGATPLLLAVVVCIVVLRLYPLPLLALQRRAQSRPGAVGLLGSAGSVRASGAAFTSVMTMVVGVFAAVFSLVLVSSITSGLDKAAASETGADIRVDAAALDDLDGIAAVDGVRAVAGLDTVPGVEMLVGRDRPHVTVVFADVKALHAVRPDIPVVPLGSILVSADIAERAEVGTELNGHPVSTAGVIPSLALPQVSRDWVLVDITDAAAILGEQPSYETALLATRPGADIAATAARVRELVADAQLPAERDRVRVTDTATLVAQAASRPSIAGFTVALLASAAFSLLLCVVAVALGALGAASARARDVGVLRLLGMSPPQLRGVLAWELAPMTITAALAGTALGIGLAAGVTALVDLRAVVGGVAGIGASIPWPVVAGVVVGFAAVVTATGAVAAAVARRRDASAAVKMGAE